MRDYGKVHTSFWTSSTIREMSEDARTLSIYLLTSPHSTIAGVFRLPDGYACEDLQWSTTRVSKAFAELFAKGYANRCETTKWVWVCKHLEWNPPENPNQRKSAMKIANSIPSECHWKLDFMRVCGHLLGIESTEENNPSETLPKPFLNQEQEQEQKQEQKKEAVAPFVFPSWIPMQAWNGYAEMRKKAKKPMTDRAMELKIIELQKFKDAGFDIAAILDKSTANNWTDLYEQKTKPLQAVSGSPAWVMDAGFTTIAEANNEGCYQRTAHQFKNGKREVAA